MSGTRKILGALLLFSLAVALAALPQHASSRPPQAMQEMQHGGAEEAVPAYHAQIPHGQLPATMSATTFPDPLVANAYTVAARIKKTLYQMPCYCHCDRSQGHGSLLDCFVSRHGAGCDICVREDLYAYEQARKGKSAVQIREGIIHGDWQQLDFSKYQSALLPAAK